MPESVTIKFAPLDDRKNRTTVALGAEKVKFSPSLRAFDEDSDGLITKAATIARFKGEKKGAMDLLAPQGLAMDRLIVMGLGDVERYEEIDWLALGGRLRAKLAAVKARSADILLEGPEARSISAEEAAQVAFGFVLRGYEFKKYKKKKSKAEEEDDDSTDRPLKSVRFLHPDAEDAEAQFAPLRAIGDGVFLARDLINEPANMLGPEAFAKRVRSLEKYGLDIEVLDEARLRELGMGALLAVGRGSAQPSLVVTMQWRGAGNRHAKPLAFIGKGVCFDSGGISIKPAQGMEDMKGDMGGAAAVTGLMLTLARRKAPVNAVGVIGLTENMISGTAQRPGDIVTSMSGQTIEVLNTDAEGRLVLADVLWYCQQTFKPRLMVSLATLTGAIIVALGKEYAGLFANDDALAGQLAEAGRETDEKVWRLPLGDKYNKMIDSKIADMKNLSGREAGSITAAQFLARFVDPEMPWAHLDVAGTAIASPSSDINPSWGSGFGVRLLDRLVRKFHQE